MTPATIDAEARPLSPRHAEFAEHIAAGESQLAAYVAVYGVEPSPSAVVCACKLARRADVTRRVRELREASAERTTLSIAERMQWLDEIRTASPPVRVVSTACRRCYGHEGRWQWIDEHELEAAVIKAMRASQPAPDVRGGFGYSVALPGNPECPHCAGRLTRTEMLPTHEWSAAQRAAFKGVELNADGSIKKLLTEDRMAASDQLNRLAGAYIERRDVRSVNVSMTAQEAAKLAQRTPAEIVAALFPPQPGAAS